MKKAGGSPAFSLLIHPSPLKSIWIIDYLIELGTECRKYFLIGFHIFSHRAGGNTDYGHINYHFAICYG